MRDALIGLALLFGGAFAVGALCIMACFFAGLLLKFS